MQNYDFLVPKVNRMINTVNGDIGSIACLLNKGLKQLKDYQN